MEKQIIHNFFNDKIELSSLIMMELPFIKKHVLNVLLDE
jgi:hypothetical protein